METYTGQVRTPADAIILFEACRLGHLPRVQRRLSEKERQQIKSGSIFVWDEREAGMRRWTDGKSWSASRVSGSFLTYREMEGKRGGGSNFSGSTTVMGRGNTAASDVRNDPMATETSVASSAAEGPDGYRYKPDGLVKQSFSITTRAGQHLHLISYFARSHPTSASMLQPSNDPSLRNVRPQKDLYPESTMDVHSIPAVTRSPMVGSSYASSPSGMRMLPGGPAHPQPSPSQHFGAHSPYGPWPPSPMSTPPAHHYAHSPYLHGHPSASSHSSPLVHYYQQQHQAHMIHHPRPPGPTAFDRAPPPLSGLSPLPPPPLPPQIEHAPSIQQQEISRFPQPLPPYAQPLDSGPNFGTHDGPGASMTNTPRLHNDVSSSAIDPRLTAAPQFQQPPQQQQQMQGVSYTSNLSSSSPSYMRPLAPVTGQQSPTEQTASGPAVKTIPSINSIINGPPSSTPIAPSLSSSTSAHMPPPPPPPAIRRTPSPQSLAVAGSRPPLGASSMTAAQRVAEHASSLANGVHGPAGSTSLTQTVPTTQGLAAAGSSGPSNKPFVEDSRALRQLDRAFAA